MKPLSILILGILFLFLGRGESFSYPPGYVSSVDPASYNKEYADYTKAVRVKIGDNIVQEAYCYRRRQGEFGFGNIFRWKIDQSSRK